MKNTKLKIIMAVTALLPTAAVLTVLPFLPEKIPAHYDLNMNINRWGSKYESLIFPAAAILMAAYMYAMSRFSSKQENGDSNAKVMLICGIIINIFLGVMTVWFLALSFKAVSGIKINCEMFVKFVFICVGIVTSVIGNFIPKCKINSVIGLRTKWSMENEDIWFKCQRFGGALFVFCGILMVVISAILKNTVLIITANIIISIIIAAGSILGSKIIYDKTVGKIQ